MTQHTMNDVSLLSQPRGGQREIASTCTCGWVRTGYSRDYLDDAVAWWVEHLQSLEVNRTQQ